MIIRYDDNAAVVIDQEGNPKGTRIFGAIARELRQLNFTKYTLMLTISIAIPVIWRRSLEKYLVPILVNSPSSFFG
ncbi:hypothetical protein UlMin_038991 [Ulmus minor]